MNMTKIAHDVVLNTKENIYLELIGFKSNLNGFRQSFYDFIRIFENLKDSGNLQNFPELPSIALNMLDCPSIALYMLDCAWHTTSASTARLPVPNSSFIHCHETFIKSFFNL